MTQSMPEGAQRRLVFLHGFTQTHHHWHAVAHRISGMLVGPTTSSFVDLPGHGLSGDDLTSLDHAPAALAELGGSGTWIGYSMGARFALMTACAGAPQIERLVMIGGTAGLIEPAERAARAADDEARAVRLEANGIEAFIDEWMALPMFARLPHDPDDRPHRLRNTTSGLASSLRTSGTGAQRSVWDQLGAVSIPVLVLAGERDTKFVEIGQRLAADLPNADLAVIPDAGHAAHNERPQQTAELIAAWLP